MKVELRCNKCMKDNVVNGFDLIKKTKDDLVITYYVCKHCKAIHTVQLDNESTLKHIVIVKELMSKLSRYKANNNTPPKKMVAKFAKARKSLINERVKLQNDYKGKEVMIDGHYIPLTVEHTEEPQEG